ncbi:hypothetical protein F0L68_23370 [Solihabitans fulvus]|uniref:Lipopolysaccharide assembly protein A domain-containing protein n=1 Tax=Solihabitans fulvus TaxID=1892852 RepID=A0A5B2X7B1_9PSEU|nr:hypothetical protein [Solihabitans fulvus]KAA2258772.1 hypothetical protein F0L68_23370 [Solihabitans fulvus]
MLILGLVLIVLSAGYTTLLFAYNNSGGPYYTVTMFGHDVASLRPAGVFAAGILTALVFCLGVWMVVSTERRRRVARLQYREARQEADLAATERDKLAKQLRKTEEARQPIIPQQTTTVVPEQTTPKHTRA